MNDTKLTISRDGTVTERIPAQTIVHGRIERAKIEAYIRWFHNATPRDEQYAASGLPGYKTKGDAIAALLEVNAQLNGTVFAVSNGDGVLVDVDN